MGSIIDDGRAGHTKSKSASIIKPLLLLLLLLIVAAMGFCVNQVAEA